MKEKRKRNNVETLLGVIKTPSDNRIRTLLDGIEPSAMGAVFEQNLTIAEEAGILEGYRVLAGGVLLALDGLWHYSSKDVHCDHCLHMTNSKGETMYWTASMRRGSGDLRPTGRSTDGLRRRC
jgi:hypothetical protein